MLKLTICALVLVASATAMSLPGGITDLDKSDEMFKKVILKAETEMSNLWRSNHHYRDNDAAYRVLKVNRITKQVVAGIKYQVELHMAGTKCKAFNVDGDIDKLRACEFDLSLKQYKSDFGLLYEPWLTIGVQMHSVYTSQIKDEDAITSATDEEIKEWDYMN